MHLPPQLRGVRRSPRAPHGVVGSTQRYAGLPSSGTGVGHSLTRLVPVSRGTGLMPLREQRKGPSPAHATMCYMSSITHRELRNQSAEVLRRVHAGESIQITNNGRPTARIVPIRGSALDELLDRGEARPALTGTASLRAIRRAKSDRSSAEIIADSRGRW